jgi:hypothetical protein
LLATCVATAVTTTDKLLALLPQLQRGIRLEDGSTGVGPALETILLSGLCDFAYGGSFPAAIWLARLVSRKAGRGFITDAAFLLMCLWFAGGLFWGFLVRAHLPLSWEAVMGLPGAVLLAAIGVAMAASRHVPASAARGELSRPPGPRATAAGAPAAPSRLTGLRLLVVREITINVSAVVILFLVLLIFRGFTIDGSNQSAVGELRSALMTDTTTFATGVIHPTAAAFLLIVSLRNGIQPVIRQLRTLPIGAWRLNATIVGTSTLSVAVACGLFMLLRLLLVQRPPQAGDVAMIATLSGLAALTQSIQLRLGQAWSLAGLGVILIVLLAANLLEGLPGGELPITPLNVGCGAIVLAMLLNHRWLTRSATTYRPSADVTRAILE